MKINFSFLELILFSLFLISSPSDSTGNPLNNNDIQFLSPVPESEYNNCKTNIIITFKENIENNGLSNRNLRITGSSSGEHSYEIINTGNNKTFLLKPHNDFWKGESVEVNVLKGIMSIRGYQIDPFSFKFKISNIVKANSDRSSILNTYQSLAGYNTSYNISISNPPFVSDSLPPDFPQIKIIRKYGTSPGYVFIANIRFDTIPYSPYLLILDNLGYPVKYKKMDYPCADFKAQKNNMFTYYDFFKQKFYLIDTTFAVLDSFYCGNGYTTDVHEILLNTDNKHAYLLSYDPQSVDMSKIVSGGDTSAVVIGLVIQEIDENKNVIFQWRSWDNFQITDAHHENMQSKMIDCVHGNAIDLDYDGNILLSSRHLDEITKINRQTGQIIWRFGGKNNQFNFTNDPDKFYYQHSIRKTSNGNYILFDNGNFHNPPYSRAVEYQIDEVKKTARLVWQFRNSPDEFSFAMGNVKRLPNGNTTIGWGTGTPAFSEVRPNGFKVFELELPYGEVSYRAYRNSWDGMPQVPVPAKFALYQNYPNPFNPMTTIKYDLTERDFVTLKLYDVVGREVKVLISEEQEAGTYLLDFYAGNLASGIYFYKLQTDHFSAANKMVLVK